MVKARRNMATPVRGLAKPSADSMSPAALRKLILPLAAETPITDSLERAMAGLDRGSGWEGRQKQHLLGWLGEYDGPGFYGRANWNRSARFVYNQFQCAAGLLWLAEASGAPRAALLLARKAVLAAGPRNAAQSAAMRRVLPWAAVAALLR